MSQNKCEVIRQELDELMLDETISTRAVEHLRECAACREFNEKQTRLRQMVGSLGTVSAPPDFDFRLRARLANANAAAFHFWPVARRGLAFAAVLLVFVTGAILVRNVFNRPAEPVQVATTDQHNTAPAPAPQVAPTIDQRHESGPAPQSNTSYNTRSQAVRTERPARIKRPLVAEDFSSERALLYKDREPAVTFEVLPQDSSLQSYKFSFDDGRGNARTISVPTISFGSQRMLPTASQYASKRDW
jgi:hypothetical protein